MVWVRAARKRKVGKPKARGINALGGQIRGQSAKVNTNPTGLEPRRWVISKKEYGTGGSRGNFLSASTRVRDRNQTGSCEF